MRSPLRGGSNVSGPKDSKTDARSALADFFGDDDMWDDEEDAEGDAPPAQEPAEAAEACLLYTSDAADE